jgi:hypothetical protein
MKNCEYKNQTRKVNPNSLLGLLWTLKLDAEGLQVQISRVEKRLRTEGYDGTPEMLDAIANLTALPGLKKRIAGVEHRSKRRACRSRIGGRAGPRTPVATDAAFHRTALGLPRS